jgi:hypothetical protein
MKKISLAALLAFTLILAFISAAQANSGRVVGTQCWINGKLVGGFPPGYTCPGTTGGSSGGSSRSNPAVYGGFYQLGYAFGQWLMGSDSNPQAELQRRQMMEELQRRQAEAERQRQEEAARRLAEMYNRLKTTLKLSGLPNLQLKGMETGGPGLKLKLGEGDGGHVGVKGLPGVYLNDGKEPYGIPGLPGIYTGGPGEGSGLKNSGLALKMGDQGTGAAQSAAAPEASAAAANGPASTAASGSGLQLREGDEEALAAAQANLRDPGKMTPQQLADAAELFSRLSPEDQQRFLTATQDNATAGRAPSPQAVQPSAYSPTNLREQADASQAAARAQVPEDASEKARAGFDQPLASTPLKLKTGASTPLASAQTGALAKTGSGVPASPAAKDATTDEALRTVTIKQINVLANHLGWDDKKRKRLDVALNKLAPAFDRSVTQEQIKQTWQTILIRGREIESLRGGSLGGVSAPAGAGGQTRFEDCAVFALANAVGLPYGVVAARATELIRLGDWRSAEDRANPQAAIEKGGLTGGEVILLAESFGQAEVIPRSAFEKILNEGRPIMVNVVPPDGNWNRGHEVVLTKTVQYQNDTWFEIMDSNLGPQRRLYLTRKELDIIIQENGVAFRPEPGTTPRLLR